MSNGLHIIVWPDHDIPNVVMYNFVRAGGRNEYPGITGLSHFFEHMMFNGTSNARARRVRPHMEAAGGANNAYTSKDLTVYMNWFPVSALETIIELEADRLQNLAFDRDMIESERSVISSERQAGVDNENDSRLYEQMLATAFVAHPYQFPIIGWPSDIAGWTQADLESYFQTYYAPNNCTMVFVGAVSPEAIFMLADRYLAPIPAQRPPPPYAPSSPNRPASAGCHRDRCADAAAARCVPRGQRRGPRNPAHGAVAEHSDRRQLVAAAPAAGRGRSSSRSPSAASSWRASTRASSTFDLTLPPDADIGAVEARLLEELTRVASEGVTPGRAQQGAEHRACRLLARPCDDRRQGRGAGPVRGFHRQL